MSTPSIDPITSRTAFLLSLAAFVTAACVALFVLQYEPAESPKIQAPSQLSTASPLSSTPGGLAVMDGERAST